MLGPGARVLKRGFDIAGAVAGLGLSWPLLGLIAAAVRLESEGPALYRGRRAGLGGEPFYILKFRTMVVDAEAVGGTTTALGDPRITTVGAFLRRYKLDELPQLLNVLRGEMSFVGPRPEVYEYVDQYTDEERVILTVKPGITDLASIEFHDLAAVVGHEDADEVFRTTVLERKNQLRMEYATQQSLRLDMIILARTLAVLVGTSVRGER